MDLNARLSRALRGVRRWRGLSVDDAIAVAEDLSDGDWRRISAEIDAVVERRGGPVAARRRAGTIALTYETLSQEGRRRFFTNLALEYGHDDQLVDDAIDAVIGASSPEERRRAEVDLRDRLRPRSELLLRRLASLDDGLPLLVAMRADLLPHRRSTPELATLDSDLRAILEGLFDVGLLHLQRLTWDTPASFLEKLIQYEAVHAIESWDDLKRRLGVERRCYAFVHPGMPDDPLIFVEVALTKNIARQLEPLLGADQAEPDEQAGGGRAAAEKAADRVVDEDSLDTAIFYSISNCHEGLAGVSLGDFLIKSVVEELSAELPKLKTFATLSPIPGFHRWLEELVAAGDERLGECHATPPFETVEELRAVLSEVVQGEPRRESNPTLARLKPVLMRLAAIYLTETKRGDRAADPVAHFHLSNGARVEHLNWMGNPSAVGWERGLSMMVNYRYDLKTIEANHDAYTNSSQIAASDELRKLTEGPKA
ncbi:MAG: malonyl-CoA decarboxylase domain-containing protein [Acidimicrobiales bacterium]